MTVKRLVWTEVVRKFRGAPHDARVWRADTPFGHYTVFSDGTWWSPPVNSKDDGTGTTATVELSQEACQADFEKRVAACREEETDAPNCAGLGHDHPAHRWELACLYCGVFRGSDLVYRSE